MSKGESMIMENPGTLSPAPLASEMDAAELIAGKLNEVLDRIDALEEVLNDRLDALEMRLDNLSVEGSGFQVDYES